MDRDLPSFNNDILAYPGKSTAVSPDLGIALHVPGTPSGPDHCLTLPSIDPKDCFILRLPRIWKERHRLVLAPAFLEYWLYGDLSRAKVYSPTLRNVGPEGRDLEFDLEIVQKGRIGGLITEGVYDQHIALMARLKTADDLMQVLLEVKKDWKLLAAELELAKLKVGQRRLLISDLLNKSAYLKLPSVNMNDKVKVAIDYLRETSDFDTASSLGNFKLQAVYNIDFFKKDAATVVAEIGAFFWRLFDMYEFSRDKQLLGLWRDPASFLPIKLTNQSFLSLADRKAKVQAAFDAAAGRPGTGLPRLLCQEFVTVTKWIPHRMQKTISIELTL